MAIGKLNWEITCNEIKRNVKKNIIITLILILQCTVCFTLIALVIANTLTASSSVNHLKEYIGNKSYYSLHDDADDDGSYQKYINSELEYFKLYKFVDELRNNKDFSFISTIIQPVELFGKDIPEKFRYGYEEGIIEEPFILDNEFLIGVKSVQVSKNVFSEFDISVDEGRSFLEQDFVLGNDGRGKVILGNQYKDYYGIGDSFECIYLFEKMSFEVIGFLPPDTYIPRNGRLLYVDRYIIIPAFSEIDIDRYQDLAQIALLQQANGQIVTSKTNLDVPRLVNDLSDKYNTLRFRVFEIGKTEVFNTITLSDEIVKKILLIAIILIIFTVVGLSTSILGRVRENYYRYGVHLISGATLPDIIYQMVGIILFIIGCALFTSLIISIILTGFGLQLIMVIFVAMIVFILASIIPTIIINRLDINHLIRRKE
ncbi:hypothetical protein [Alkaliphilus crotonatoxidans]